MDRFWNKTDSKRQVPTVNLSLIPVWKHWNQRRFEMSNKWIIIDVIVGKPDHEHLRAPPLGGDSDLCSEKLKKARLYLKAHIPLFK